VILNNMKVAEKNMIVNLAVRRLRSIQISRIKSEYYIRGSLKAKSLKIAGSTRI
jgi:hypothetical protein